MSELGKFLEERSKIPIPNGDTAWIKLLAKELALGVHRNLWEPWRIARLNMGRARTMSNDSEDYFTTRWKDRDVSHLVGVLVGHEYMIRGEDQRALHLSTKAYDLLEDVEPYDVFISYKRSESSALALLVLARLKEHSLVPFVDMALEAGGNWHADLEKRIKDCDYFIVLLGEKTLSSDMTVKEICWASESNRTIIPVWHNKFGRSEDFDLKAKIYEYAPKWEDKFVVEKEDLVIEIFQQTNAIIVHDESASGYNTAIVELLNRFGITP